MHTQKSIGSRRHVVTRFLVTTALLGSTFLVGLATTASAAPPYHIVIATPPFDQPTPAVPRSREQPIIDIDNTGEHS